MPIEKIHSLLTCRECGGNTTVVDSRSREDGTARRRRKCVDCELRFTTTEIRCDELRRIEAKTYDALLTDLDDLLNKYGRRS